MTKFILAAGVLLASLQTSPALAQSLPRYDATAACRGLGPSAAKAKSETRGCLESEKAAYENLRDSWSDLAGDIRATCQHVATASGPASYALFWGCVELENADRQDAERRFADD